MHVSFFGTSPPPPEQWKIVDGMFGVGDGRIDAMTDAWVMGGGCRGY